MHRRVTQSIQSLSSQSKPSKLYQKSLQLRTDFSMNNKYYRLYHPKYWDADRTRTQYLREKRDYKHLQYNTADVLFYDHRGQSHYGGFRQMVENLKMSQELSGRSSSYVSPYKCINLMFNMVKAGLLDREFFTRLEKLVNTSTMNYSGIDGRFIYGYLYSCYRFNIARTENLLFFENALEAATEIMHTEMSLDLLEASLQTSLLTRDRFYRLYGQFYELNISSKWLKEIKYKPDNCARLAGILREGGVLQPKLWDMIFREANDFQSHGLPTFDILLNAMHWYLSTPKSPGFQDAAKTKILEAFRTKHDGNANRMYKYNTQEMRYRTYDELLARRESVTSKCYIEEPLEEEFEEEEDKKEEEVTVPIEEILPVVRQRVGELGEAMLQVRLDLEAQYGGKADGVIQEAFRLFNLEKQEMLVQKLIKDNKFEQLFENQFEAAQGEDKDKGDKGEKGDKAGKKEEKGADKKAKGKKK